MAQRQSQFFKDYDLEEYVDEQGQVRQRYAYRGDLFERALPEARQRTERAAEVLGAVLGGGLYLLAATRDTPANKSGFFGVLSILALVPVLCVLVGACVACFRKGKLTRRDYIERRILLLTMSLAAAACLLVLAAGYAVHGAWLALGAALAAAALYAAVGVREIRVGYIVHPGAKAPASDADDRLS